ncbi:hypothetical protein U1Q18_048293 [Sarracenia purpurea var. burkii]
MNVSGIFCGFSEGIITRSTAKNQALREQLTVKLHPISAPKSSKNKSPGGKGDHRKKQSSKPNESRKEPNESHEESSNPPPESTQRLRSQSVSSSSSEMGEPSTSSHMIFRGVNFETWKMSIEALIRAKDLYDTIERENGGDAKMRAKTYEIILNHLDDGVLRLVQEKLAECNVKLSNEEEYMYIITGLKDYEAYRSIRITAEGLLNVMNADPTVIRNLICARDDAKSTGDRDTGKKITEVFEVDSNLLAVKFTLIQDSKFDYFSKAFSAIWHRRLGHASKKVMYKVPDIDVSECDCPSMAECGICAKAKQTKNPYSATRFRYEKPFFNLH